MDRVHFARPSIVLVLTCLALLLAAPAAHAREKRHAAKVARVQVTRASWYGESFRGRRAADGSAFNPQHLTAAHRSLHIGSKVKVTELASGRSVVVKITDRGPFLPGRGIDLSYAAARQLGIVHRGVARVSVELVAHEKSTDPPIVTASNWEAKSWSPKAIIE